jgi:hypothetical protein
MVYGVTFTGRPWRSFQSRYATLPSEKRSSQMVAPVAMNCPFGQSEQQQESSLEATRNAPPGCRKFHIQDWEIFAIVATGGRMKSKRLCALKWG